MSHFYPSLTVCVKCDTYFFLRYMEEAWQSSPSYVENWPFMNDPLFQKIEFGETLRDMKGEFFFKYIHLATTAQRSDATFEPCVILYAKSEQTVLLSSAWNMLKFVTSMGRFPTTSHQILIILFRQANYISFRQFAALKNG